ncbi:MAG: tetratricopeptide repeat protein [Pseudoflavonifractor sp.]|nr:tetratricopeptide repeat protein [Pseudoflavonifractor sp.]
MKRIALLLAVICTGVLSMPAADNSTKKERNYIREGNGYYNDKNFSEAEKAYRKALELNEASELAAYNLAVSLIRQSGNADPNADNNPMQEATNLLNDLAKGANDSRLAELAFYNLGNVAFNQQQYQQSIDMYKGALRRNPDNDKARQNLRLAQLRLQQQQQDKDNQDKDNKDNKDNKDQDKNKDKNQDQDKNQDKNQDKDKDNKDQQNQQDKQQNNNDRQQQQQQQQQGGISDENAAKILKTMENEENATRKRVNELKKQEEKAARRRTGNQW